MECIGPFLDVDDLFGKTLASSAQHVSFTLHDGNRLVMIRRTAFICAVSATAIAVFLSSRTAGAQGKLERLRGTPKTLSAIENAFNECLRRDLRGTTNDLTVRGISAACARTRDTHLQSASTEITGQIQNSIIGGLRVTPFQTSGTFDYYHNTAGLSVTRIQILYGPTGRQQQFDCTPFDVALPAKTTTFACQIHSQLQGTNSVWTVSRVFGIRL